MRLLTLLLLLLAAPGWAQWSSTVDKPAIGYLEAYDAGLSLGMATGGTYYEVTGLPVNRGYSTGGSYVTTGSDAITIGTAGAGVYSIALSMSFEATTGEYHCDVHVNEGGGDEDTEIGFRRKIANSSDYGSASGIGIWAGTDGAGVDAGDVFSVYCKAVADGETMTIDHLHLVMTRVGGLP